jgi:hypothetical protein
MISNLDGTSKTAFQLGLGGPSLAIDPGTNAVQHVDVNGSPVVVRGADPQNNTDLVTLQYLQALLNPYVPPPAVNVAVTGSANVAGGGATPTLPTGV